MLIMSSSQHRPVIFRVPDSTDDEEDEPSDVDDALGASVAILQQAGIRARTEVSPGWEAAIDLTSDDGLRDANPRGNNAGEDEIVDEPSTRRHTDSDELVEAEDFDRSKSSWHSYSAPSDVPPSDFSSEDSSVDSQEEGANVDICEHASSSLLSHSDDEDHAIRYISEDESFSDDEDPVLGNNVAEESQGAGQEDISESQQVVNVPATPVTYSEKGGEGSLFVPQLPDEESNVPPVPAAIDSSATVTLEAISPAFRSSQTEHDTPEDRGSWSSKAEFFAAWDHNRRMLAMTDPSPGDHHPKMDAEGDSDGDDVLPRSTILFSNAGLRDCTGTSDLLQSGERFLESPMADLTSKSTCCFTPYDPSQPTADTLDYTSAYTYEVSKRLLESKNPPRASLEVSRATAERDAEVEVFSDQQSAVKTSSSKRKIADISDLVPKDTPRHRSEGESALVVAETEAVLALDTAPGNIASQASEHEVAYRRPTKRLRRAAEIVGFAALGGAAVMTALIATAPVL